MGKLLLSPPNISEPMEQVTNEKQALLITAMKEAAYVEKQYISKQRHHKSIDSMLKKRMDDIIHIELPEKFGKLMSSLDLQKQFMALGLHVRGFAETGKILNHLAPLMADRLEKGTVADLGVIDSLIAICDEMKATVSLKG